MNKFLAVIVTIILIVVVGSSVFFGVIPTGKAIWNNWFHAVQKVDDDTNYKTKKKVEDTCRAMIASYNADKLTYEQYRDGDSEEKQGWAEQAKMRANKTANTYNEYILKNSFVFEGNIPTDIETRLMIID